MISQTVHDSEDNFFETQLVKLTRTKTVCGTWYVDALSGEQKVADLLDILDVEDNPKCILVLRKFGFRAVYESNKAVFSVKFTKTDVILECFTDDREWWENSLKPKLQSWGEENKMMARDNEVPITFSYLNARGVVNTVTRRLLCPPWDDVSANYPHSDEITKLVQMTRPFEKGKLVFWHGPPGNGKTFAIRSLIHKWQERAHIIYVTDPEKFLNTPAYIFELLLDSFDNSVSKRCDSEEEEVVLPEDRFKVLILEDSLDFVIKSNRAHIGHQMSRLLNLTDGFIGQGLNLLLILTTNEELKEIDPAFTRPGRCLQTLKFDPLSRIEAKTWCDRNNTELPGEDKDLWSLAELYAAKPAEEVVLGEIREPVGFSVSGVTPK